MKKLLFSTCIFIFSIQLAYADGAYKWTDKDGRIFYGSKPPSEAKEVKEIETEYVSKYSSTKVIKRLQPEKVEEEKVLEEPIVDLELFDTEEPKLEDGVGDSNPG